MGEMLSGVLKNDWASVWRDLLECEILYLKKSMFDIFKKLVLLLLLDKKQHLSYFY